jgi:transcriptional regulator with XRE-family HTH domain
VNYEQFFIRRLAELRKQKGVSAQDMSLSLGQNENYVNHIENGKMFPSMQAFFALCEYLNITPRDFFNTEDVAAKE